LQEQKISQIRVQIVYRNDTAYNNIRPERNNQSKKKGNLPVPIINSILIPLDIENKNEK